jgi:hypothetical protein
LRKPSAESKFVQTMFKRVVIGGISESWRCKK